MKRELRAMLVVVETNLLLWLVVCGMAWANAESGASWWRGARQLEAGFVTGRDSTADGGLTTGSSVRPGQC